jgi:hypothetical protein
MPEPNGAASKTKPAPKSEVVTTRVNVAFPFSQIKMQEPSEDLAALTALFREMADLLVEVAPGPKARELRRRARDLSSRVT